MTSRRWNTLVSGLILPLTLATAGSARAQFGVVGAQGHPAISQFGEGSGSGVAFGLSPYNYAQVGGVGYGAFDGYSGGYGTLGTFPGFGTCSGGLCGVGIPQTTASYRSVSSAVSIVPGWDGPSRRVRRRR